MKGTRFVLSRIVSIFVVVVMCGCSFVPPSSIPSVQESREFSGTSGGQNDADVMGLAQQCVDRLNSHRDAAVDSNGVRTVFAVVISILGGSVGGGAGLATLLSNEPQTRQVGGWVATISPLVGVIGASIGAALTDPTQRIALRARAAPFYQLAAQHAEALRRDPSDPDDHRPDLIRSLRICISDGDLSQFPVTP
jgi:hypothetical protein